MTVSVLVTGAGGQLGRELLRQGGEHKFELVPAGRSELDVAEAADVERTVSRAKPFAVINAAAYTQVDGAEAEPHQAFRVNTEGAANLARTCRSAGIPLIHISTDYVFDGTRDNLYMESDPIAPQGVYARSKAAGEERVRSILHEHLILRTSWLYSPYGHNFVKTMLRLGCERRIVDVVDDQFGSPTSAADLAGAILHIVADIQRASAVPWGTYHYCGKGVASRHEFAQKIFSLAASHRLYERPQVRAVSTDRYPTPAPRPRFSALDCSRIQKNFGIFPLPWPESLACVIQRIIRKKDT